MHVALDRAREGAWAAIFVLGDPAFYGRFGFRADAARGFASPYAGEHFMVVPLGPAPLPGIGTVVHPAPFTALG